MTFDKRAWKTLFKDVFVGVVSSDDEAALAMAADTVGQSGGHLVALLLSDFPALVNALEASQGVNRQLADAITVLRAESEQKRQALEARLRLATASFEMRSVDEVVYSASESAVRSARYADIAILQRPASGLGNAIRRQIAQDVICKSGKPVLLVPPAWSGGLPLHGVVVAWDGSKAATRALDDGAALLASAARVTVLVVSGDAAGDTRGQDVCTHLARHGLDVALNIVAAEGRDVGATLLQAAGDLDADLLIMGGFGHSPTKEWVLGGVTRHVIANAEIPIFLSH